MAIPDKPDYTHGSTGTKPPNGRNFETRDELPADELDWLFNTPIESLKDVIGYLDTVDTDGDGKVDAAETADSANSVNGADVNGQVSSAAQADVADQAARFEVRTNDPSNPDDGQVWIRSDL